MTVLCVTFLKNYFYQRPDIVCQSNSLNFRLVNLGIPSLTLESKEKIRIPCIGIGLIGSYYLLLFWYSLFLNPFILPPLHIQMDLQPFGSITRFSHLGKYYYFHLDPGFWPLLNSLG